MAYVGLWPLVGLPQGDSSSVNGSVSSGASVSGVGIAAITKTAEVTASSAVTGVSTDAQGFLFGPWRVLGLVNGMGLYAGAIASGAAVSGQAASSNVQTAQLGSGAVVAGYDSSLGTGTPGFIGLRPFLTAHGSTTVLPWGAVRAEAFVAGEGVYSIAGDYATPPRSVFDIPPPVDFKIPGITLDYGLPTSLRAPGVAQAEVTAYSSASGQFAAAIARTAAVRSEAAVAGDLRAVVVRTSEVAAGAHVSGVVVGYTVAVATAHITAGADVTGVDRSLAPGVGLGTVEATSSVAGERVSGVAPAAEVAAGAVVHGVDASSYPLAAAPRGAISAGATVSGEAVATIIRRAEVEARAVVAAVSTTIAIAEAAVFSRAMVRGTTVSVGGVGVGVGRNRIGSPHPRGPGRRIGSASVGVKGARIGTKKP